MKIKEKLEYLYTMGPRASGSWEELKAAEYIRETFIKAGINARIETFESPSHLALRSTLKVPDNGRVFTSLPTQFSPAGKAIGELIYLGVFDTPFIDRADLKGKIGLIIPSSGAFNHGERIDFILDLEQRGLAGLIVGCPSMDLINAKIIRYPEIKKLPSVAVSWRTGSELKRLEGKDVYMEVEHDKRMRNESQNVVVEIPGESAYWLTVSAHYDTAAFCPGASDDGGGTAVVMELAETFAGKKLPATLYFVFTGSEEYGGLDMVGAGSKAFYRKHSGEIENCIAHIDVDDIGNLLGCVHLYTAGPASFMKALKAVPSPFKYAIKKKTMPSCDHGAAVMFGIPYIWLSDHFEQRPQFHTPEDKIEYMDLEKLELYYKYITDVIKKFVSARPFYPYVKEGEKLIRPAYFKDIPDILNITRDAFGPVSMNKMQQDFFNEKIGGKEWHEYKNAAVEASLKDDIYNAVVCEINGKVVGYATVFYDAESGIANIGNNAVYTDWQGKGIGKAMQAEIKRRMKEEGYEKFAVTTLSNDIAAQKIYEKLGYSKYIEAFHYLKGF
ncbi:MAG: GNAT family N-acetyltransferase [Candidatus Omnitrophica bacterium]|nr:GNAT family N-acetyltransferase [Candidatus Omnitrophota bacterium]